MFGNQSSHFNKWVREEELSVVRRGNANVEHRTSNVERPTLNRRGRRRVVGCQWSVVGDCGCELNAGREQLKGGREMRTSNFEHRTSNVEPKKTKRKGEHGTSNVEHPTLNQRKSREKKEPCRLLLSPSFVRCSKFNVQCSYSFFRREVFDVQCSKFALILPMFDVRFYLLRREVFVRGVQC